MNRIYLIALGIWCLMLSLPAVAQVKFYANGPKQVGVNQNFQVDYVVENGEARTFKRPAFEGFQVLSGPNQSQSMQWVNGNMSQSVTFSFILHPKKEGSYHIGKAAVDVGGATMESNELSIAVTPPVKEQPQARQRDPFSDPFGDDPFEQAQEQQPQQAGADVQQQLRDNVFVRLTTDKSNVWLGEKITMSLKIYFKLNFGNTSITKAPTFNGFWSQEIPMPKDQKPQVENINGQQYYVMEVQKYNLYPQKAGTLQITPAELNMVVQAQVQSKRRSFWDMFGAQVQNIPYKPVSNAIAISVRDLPEAGKPSDFNGAVGKFSYEARLSSGKGKTDDAFTYTVKISGSGNLKTIDVVKPELPEGFEVYDPKTKEDISNTAAGMSGTKQYDYLIIPRQPGEYKIPGTSFSYFDPAVGKYFSMSSPELPIVITGEPSKNPNAGLPNAAAKEDVATLGTDIRFIKTRATSWDSTGHAFFASPIHIGLYATPIALFIGLLIVRRRNETLDADIVGAKRRRATRLAKRRLAMAEKHLKTQNKTGFYDEVSRAMWGYVGDKLNIDPAQLSKDNVAERLAARQVKPETTARLLSLISTCDVALYAPTSAGSEMQSNYDTAMHLIADIEGEMKNG